jgi:hypothetical protein
MRLSVSEMSQSEEMITCPMYMINRKEDQCFLDCTRSSGHVSFIGGTTSVQSPGRFELSMNSWRRCFAILDSKVVILLDQARLKIPQPKPPVLGR